jgi:hypothetical protein
MSTNQTAAFAAFNAAVILTNLSHSAARGVTGVARGTRDCGVSFAAGVRYAHSINKATGAAASRVTATNLAEALAAVAAAAAPVAEAPAPAPAPVAAAPTPVAEAPVAAAPQRRKNPALAAA